jgi:tetratricopeptide (TPR) repeat protein
VTLNACESAASGETSFSNLAKALAREQVPYALGMRFPVVDDDALAFSRAFYRNLARGTPVEDALLQARLTLSKSERTWAIGVPVLYTALAHTAPGFATAPGEPEMRDAQEDALRGIISVLPALQGAFQGRIDEQIHLGNWLTGDRRPRIITIHGNGGQGKTALARVAVERFAHAWPGGVWAITLETLPTRTFFAASLARFLNINPQDMIEPAELERQLLLRLRRKRTLLLLDNLETLDEAVRANDVNAHDLVAFIKQLPGERTMLLCTSRNLLGWNGEQPLELDGLSPDEGALVFQESASLRPQAVSKQQQDSDFALASTLSQRVDGHPLGLVLLGKAFNETPPTFSLAAFVKDYETFLLSAADRFAGVDHRQRTLYANFDYSVKWLPPEQRSLLSKLWLFHAPFWLDTAVSILDPEHEARDDARSPVADQLHALWQRGLLTGIGLEEQGMLLYRVLPVMRPYIERYLADESERAILLALYGSAYARLTATIYSGLGRGSLAPTMAVLCYDDLERGLNQVTGIAHANYQLQWGWILHRLGDQTQAIALTEQALELGQELDQRLMLQALNNLAVVYHAIGRTHDALRLHEQALPIMREVGNRAGEGTTLNNLGLVYNALGQQAKAIAYYQQALPIMREVGDRAGEGTTLNNLGKVYNALGQQAKAIAYFEQALAIRREVGDRAGEGATLHNIGTIFAQSGQLDAALACVLLAKVLYEYVQSPSDIEDEVQTITALQSHLGEEQFAKLLDQVKGREEEIVQRALQKRTISDEMMPSASTMPNEQINIVVGNTVAVMTTMPERHDEWREAMAQALQDAKARGFQIEGEFFTAILAILDGESPSLSADHPYAQAIAAIQDGIAHGGFDMVDEDEDAVSEEVQALAALVQVSIAALRSVNPDAKLAFIQQLVALQAQVPEDEMKALFQALQLALLGGDLTHLGDTLTGLAQQVWEMIVAGVQQDNTPQHETPDAE